MIEEECDRSMKWLIKMEPHRRLRHPLKHFWETHSFRHERHLGPFAIKTDDLTPISNLERGS
jgi:hypothetical protein